MGSRLLRYLPMSCGFSPSSSPLPGGAARAAPVGTGAAALPRTVPRSPAFRLEMTLFEFLGEHEACQGGFVCVSLPEQIPGCHVEPEQVASSTLSYPKVLTVSRQKSRLINAAWRTSC